MAPTAYAAGGGDVNHKTPSPYRTYAIYLSRNYTPVSNTQIGQYFGNISCSAVTKIGSRMKERIEKDQRVREEIRKVEGKLSPVKGLPFALP